MSKNYPTGTEEEKRSRDNKNGAWKSRNMLPHACRSLGVNPNP